MPAEQTGPGSVPLEAELGQQNPNDITEQTRIPSLGGAALDPQITGSGGVEAFAEPLPAEVTPPFPPAQIESTGEDQATTEPLEQQLKRLYGELFKPPLTVASQKDLPPITLDQIPTLRTKFQELGIPDELATDMYDAWTTYRGLDVVQKDMRKATLSDLTPAEVQQAVEQQTYSVDRQVWALERHIRRYGLEEVLELHKIFNTSKFAIYEQGQLHDQLLRWKRGERIDDVGVIAQADISDKLFASELVEGLRRKWMYTLIRSRPPVFEVNDKVGVAKVAVAVGQHERAAGRKPNIKNLLIYGHGGVTTEGGHVKLGREAWITTNDYVVAAEKRERAAQASPIALGQYRINNYVEHLGPNFETILIACHGAEELPNGKASLTEAMHHGHNLTITGAGAYFTLFRKLWNGKIHFYTLGGVEAQPRSFRRKRVR